MEKKHYILENKPVNNEPLSRHLIASASIRIIARCIDLIVLFFFLFFTGAAIFYHGVPALTNNNVTYAQFIPMMFGKDINLYSHEITSQFFAGWKYCLYTWEIFLVCFFWFVLIPWWTKGRTLGKFICQITTISLTHQANYWYFLWALIRKEFFLWMLMAIALIIYGFVCLGLGAKAANFNVTYLQSSNTNGFKSFNAVYFFVFLFSVIGLIDFIIVIWMFFSSHKMNIQDDASHTTVVYIKQLQTEINQAKKDVKIDPKKVHANVLPGEVSQKELEILIKNSEKKDKKHGR